MPMPILCIPPPVQKSKRKAQKGKNVCMHECDARIEKKEMKKEKKQQQTNRHDPHASALVISRLAAV